MIYKIASSEWLASHIALSVKQARTFKARGLRTEGRHALCSARNAKRELLNRSAAQ